MNLHKIGKAASVPAMIMAVLNRNMISPGIQAVKAAASIPVSIPMTGTVLAKNPCDPTTTVTKVAVVRIVLTGHKETTGLTASRCVPGAAPTNGMSRLPGAALTMEVPKIAVTKIEDPK